MQGTCVVKRQRVNGRIKSFFYSFVRGNKIHSGEVIAMLFAGAVQPVSFRYCQVLSQLSNTLDFRVLLSLFHDLKLKIKNESYKF